jgi:hypothetical protein
MKYTIQRGVNHPFSERFSSNSRYLLPLLVILVGLLFFVINPYHTTKKPSPLTLGIYTVKSSTSNPGGSNNNDSTGGNSDLSGSGQNANVNPQLGVVTPLSGGSAPAGTSPNPSAAIGGMGGGLPDTGTGSTGGSGTGGTGGTTPSPTTVSCVNQLTQTATLCVFPYQTCTIPLSPVIGYKTVDGTCIVIN